MVTFEGKQLLELMAKNEEDVAELYEEIAANALKGKGEKFFQVFAEDEKRHGKIYKSLLEKYIGDEVLTTEMDSEDAEYLELLIKDNIMKNKDELIEKAKKIYGRDEIYNIAESVERETVLYVTEIIRLFPKLAPEEMDIILQEEKKHLKKILQRKYEYGTSVRGL